MGKKIILFMFVVLCACCLYAQAPERFSYQAVVRNDSSRLVCNRPVGVQASILNSAGMELYRERFVEETNENGLLTVEIGSGNVLFGSFSNIPWGTESVFLRTEIDPTGGENYMLSITQRLVSVPYALYAKEAANGFSGDYNDLTNKPDIPTVPTNVSSFINDAGYITQEEVPEQVNANWEATSGPAQILNKPDIPTVPANVSAFINDVGYITMESVPTVPTDVSSFNNDAGYLTTETDPQFNAWDKDYNDLTNKPVIPTVPTNVSAFINDVGYITEEDVPEQVNANWEATSGPAQILNKPVIPTVPTNVSAFTNDAGYITLESVPTVPTDVSSFNNDAGYLTDETDPQFNAWDKDYNDLTNKPELFSGNYNDLTNKPVLFSGSYNDLANKPTNADFGQALVRGMVNNPAGATDIAVTFNNYSLVTGGVVSIVFARNVPAGASLNINNQGSKPILWHGAALSDGVIKANDRCLFMYSSGNDRYYLLAIDRWGADIDALAEVARTGNYNDLANKPEIPVIPTNVSAFVNDMGYLTSIPDSLGGISVESDPVFSSWNKDYNDLTNKPAIPNDNDLVHQIGDETISGNKTLISDFSLKNTGAASGVTPFLTFQRGSLTDGYVDWKIVGDGGALQFFYSKSGLDIKKMELASSKTLFANDVEATQFIKTGGTSSQFLKADGSVDNNTYLTEHQDISGKANTVDLAPVAFSGKYTDLTNKPTLFSGNYTDLTNKPSNADFGQALVRGTVNNPAGATDIAVTFANYSLVTGGIVSIVFARNVPAGASLNINNQGSKPILWRGLPLTEGVIKANDRCLFMYQSGANSYFLLAIDRWGVDFDALAAVARTGSYTDLTNKPEIPVIPTNVSAFVNDMGYLTSIPDSFGGISVESDPVFSAWDRNYNDLTNKPTIPNDNNLVHLTGNETITGNKTLVSDLLLKNSGSASNVTPYLTFQRGTPTDSYVDWKIVGDGGALQFFYSTSGTDTKKMEITNSKALFPDKVEASQFVRTGGTASQFLKADGSVDNSTYLTTQVNADWNATNGAAQILHKPNLATVATSGNYNDLTNKPVIPTVPVDVSAFNNDAGYVSASQCGGVDICALSNLVAELQQQVAAMQATIDSLLEIPDGSPCAGTPTVSDFEGNTYNTVKIGEQCWMKENLRTTHYSDGTSIPQGGNTTSTTAPYYYNYSIFGVTLETRGYLYNWPAIMHGASSSNANPSNVQGICPTGWHLPSDAEFTQLTDYLGGVPEYQCGGSSSNIAKSLAATTGWSSNNGDCTVGNNLSTNNITGFTAFPSGNFGGSSYLNAGQKAFFWSSTVGSNSNSALYRTMYYDESVFYQKSYSKSTGFSVRCLRD